MKIELLTTLVRQGFLTVNEARGFLGYDDLDNEDMIRQHRSLSRYCEYCGGYTQKESCHNCGAPMKASGRPLSVEEVVAKARSTPNEELTRLVAEDIRLQEAYARNV